VKRQLYVSHFTPVTLLELQAVGDLPAEVHGFIHQVLQLKMEVIHLQLLLKGHTMRDK